MSNNELKSLTGAEQSIMEIVWNRFTSNDSDAGSTVNEVLDELNKVKKTAYSTVLTLMRILETKGYLAHRKRVRAFEYYPIISEKDATQNLVENFSNTFFKGSPEVLMMNLIKNSNMSKEELANLKGMIEKMEDDE